MDTWTKEDYNEHLARSHGGGDYMDLELGTLERLHSMLHDQMDYSAKLVHDYNESRLGGRIDDAL